MSKFYDLRQNLVTRPITAIEQNSTSDNENRGGNLDWTAEFKVGKQATLWSNSYMWFGDSNNAGLMKYGILDEALTERDCYDRDSDNDYFYGSMDIGLGFKQIFQQQKHELTIDGRFNNSDNNSESRLTKDFLMAGGVPVDLPIELTLNDIDSGTDGLSLQADYFRPLGKGRVDFGYRAYKRGNNHDNLLQIFPTVDADDPSVETRSGYDYRELFQSFYTTTSRTFGKFSAQVGVRAELTATDFTSLVTGDEFDRNYKSLFPSLNLSYLPKQGRTVRFLYSKRISRPSANYINPFVPSTDPLNISVGNPDLKPAYTNFLSMDFSLTGQKGTVRVAPFFRRTTDIWERIRTVDTLGVATNRWANAASAQSYGSSLSLSLPSTRRLSGSGNLSVYRDQRDGTNISSAYKRDAVMWSLGGYFGFKFRQTLTATMNANYFPSQFILQGKASGYSYTAVGLRQQLWGTKGSVSLNVNDPLALNKYNSSTSDATYKQSSRSSYRSRVAMVGFTYNFGKPPQQMSRRTGDDSGAGETIRVR